jgi:hypothetical protein
MPAEDRAELSRWTRTPSLPAGLAQLAQAWLTKNPRITMHFT